MLSNNDRRKHPYPRGPLELGVCLQVGNWNPGDGLSTYSGRSISSSAWQGASLDSWYLHEDRPLNMDGFIFPEYDHAVVMCTPWLWDQAHSSRKYGILRDFVSRMASAKKIAIGVGSSFLLHHLGLDESYPGQSAVHACRDAWESFDLVVCRDRLAAELFAEILPSDRILLLPCPSYYSAQVFQVHAQQATSDLLVWADVSTESFHGLREADVVATNALQDELVHAGYAVMTMFERDAAAFRHRFGRDPDADVRTPRSILLEIARHRSLVSPRVHACLPALSLGLETSIISLDSRALTAIGLGAKPVGTSLDCMAAFADPIENVTREEYVKLIGERTH